MGAFIHIPIEYIKKRHDVQIVHNTIITILQLL